MDEQDKGRKDLDEGLHVGFVDAETFEDRKQLEKHLRQHGRYHHIDLNAEEFTPDEVAQLLGTSRDVVLHAVRGGELKAQRAGRDILCIRHEDVVDWLRRRGPGV